MGLEKVSRRQNTHRGLDCAGLDFFRSRRYRRPWLTKGFVQLAIKTELPVARRQGVHFLSFGEECWPRALATITRPPSRGMCVPFAFGMGRGVRAEIDIPPGTTRFRQVEAPP